MYGGGSYNSLKRIGGPGSPETAGVKNVKQCSMTTKLGQKKPLMQARDDDDDLHRGQRSSEVKWGKLCAMATISGQKNP